MLSNSESPPSKFLIPCSSVLNSISLVPYLNYLIFARRFAKDKSFILEIKFV
jgi:hypothetical protein